MNIRATGKEEPKILLYTGWNIHNIGDQGHTPGTLRFLEQYFPEAHITIWLSSTNEETVKLLVDRFPKIKIVRGKMDVQGVADGTDLQSAFDETDLVIHNSGMIYNSFWKTPTILEACHHHGKPIILYGQTFDGFTDKVREHMVVQLSKTVSIYCRDVESYYYLRSIGVNPPILEFGPDGCFGIDLLNEEKAEKYLKAKDLGEKQFITVILRSNIPAGKRPAIKTEREPADTDQDPRGSDQKEEDLYEIWAGKLRKVIIRWVRETGLKVLLAPEVEEEIPYAKALLYDRLPADVQEYVVHRKEWWNMDEASSVYKRARALVSMEPHSCIMALAHGTPSIHYFSLRHGLKAWMFRDIGLPEWLYDIDMEEVDKPFRALMEIHRDYPRAKGKVERAMSFVEKRSAEMIRDIRDYCSLHIK